MGKIGCPGQITSECLDRTFIRSKLGDKRPNTNYTSTEVDIPSKTFTRGKQTIDKHLGFAFVQFENKAEADKAIEDFNGKEFKGRNIYVKKAVPPPTEEEKKQKIEAFRAKKAEQKAKRAEEQAEKAEKEQQTTKSDEALTKEANGDVKPKKTKKKAAKKAVTADASTPETATSSDDPKDKIPDGKPSADTIFITNLDYKVDVKTLNSLFKELKPKWIHVPTRRVPYHILKRQKSKGRTVFNKGIAFVKFSSEDLQKQAIADFNGKELNGREIIVDIAIDARIPKTDTEEQNSQEEASQDEKQ
ncbi:uncharacterized protein AC631_01275 [Debaryomyces fabryi]|uniref:RRM domain-containing protein n=1 Tax=Debaryomyces fabryi TaxID=58627 RepID=A0A0V1Q3N2_9ASCO|nr:uncharacterized protein AC631_01275 [Debaryomyces fabryi]KSA03020.1 hypothetical protein AC631_01275 [Debaryomyces fabryi]